VKRIRERHFGGGIDSEYVISIWNIGIKDWLFRNLEETMRKKLGRGKKWMRDKNKP
jgi:hypothetical protein